MALLVTTGNYITNGLVQTVLAWPLGGVLWMLAVGLANLFIALVLVGVGYSLVRRIVVRTDQVLLPRRVRDPGPDPGGGHHGADRRRDAYVAHPEDPGKTLAFLAGPLSGVLAPIGPMPPWPGSACSPGCTSASCWPSARICRSDKHLHILTSEPNVYFRNPGARGACARWTWRRSHRPARSWSTVPRRSRTCPGNLLDGLSCTECGRCMEFCPASLTGKTLSPKHFMEGLRDQIVMAETALSAAASAQRAARGGANGAEASDAALGLARERAADALSLPLVDNAIPEEAVWQYDLRLVRGGLPGPIEHVDSIVEIRRNLVLEDRPSRPS